MSYDIECIKNKYEPSETTIIASDYGKAFNFYLKDYNPITTLTSSFDLSSATSINFKVQKYGETTVCISSTCTITTATLGICAYTIQSGDFDNTGDYIAEIEVHESGAISTWDNIHIKVSSELPK